jgi:hypothetical protein
VVVVTCERYVLGWRLYDVVAEDDVRQDERYGLLLIYPSAMMSRWCLCVQ